MKHAFHIYPALFVLIPVKVGETIQPENAIKENEWNVDPDQYFTSCPQTYWGNCIITGDQKQFLFQSREEKRACPVQSMIDGRLNILEPSKFKGQHYTITYVPVLN
jgi:hypothetical protein